ncbi:MAG TPA: serine/threonine-protein kinase [Acidimicrobiia bacterium]|jgi:serine/threonine-protein kinase
MPEPLEPGRVLGGRYRLERVIARGGMGTVWEADDPLLARHIAVKTLDAAIGTDESIRARFRREAVAAAAVTHPNIVATYDTGEDDGVAYIVMELVHGITLRQLIDRDGAVPVDDAAAIAYQVADALSVAHARGLVHRDVKPGNVLVQPDGRVKVTDFGIAKAADSGGDELTRTGMVVGTARYLAPEQVDGGAVDERVDIYSLGLVLYEMLCGKAPFEADTDIATAVARLTSPPRPITLECPAVPSGLEHVIDRALTKDPSDRWPSALAFRDALAPFRADGPPSRADLTVPVRLPAPSAPEPATVTAPAPAGPGAGAGAGAPVAAKPRGALFTPTRIILWTAVFVIGLLAGYLGYRAIDDEPASNAAPPAPVVGPLKIVAVRDYDPEGDGHESPTQVGATFDNNPATTWSTELYKDRDVGGLKSGVGLVIDLGAPKKVVSLEVLTLPTDTDWSAQVYASDTVPAALSGWGPPRFTGQGLGSDAKLTLQAGPNARNVLLWITNLPPSRPYRLRVAELRVVGSA